MNGLVRRIEVLELTMNVLTALPCRDCALPHLGDVLTLERLSERYAGSQEPLPASCSCACCTAFLDDLTARFAHVRGAA